MIIAPNSRLDGQTEFSKGVDTYRAPSRVPRNQVCLLVNSTTRQDFISPRPRWKQLPLKFLEYNATNNTYVPSPTLQAAFEQGFFQGFDGYVPDQGASFLLWSISGQIYQVDPLGNGSVQALTMPGGLNPSKRLRAWFRQGELFHFIQDGQSVPLIFDGAKLRRSDTKGLNGTDADGKPLIEMPIGTCMAYAAGRMWVALANGTQFVAGDGVYGPTGTPQYQRRDSITRFTENNYLNGLPFAVPSNMGGIRAMVALANLDTSLGQGPLQVFTPDGAFSVDAPFDRDAWALVTNPIKTVSLINAGALSDRGAVLVNGDVWYRALDGLRSFLIARRDFGTWGNRGMSYEVIRHLKDDDRSLLGFQSGAVFDNRYISTCEPQWDEDRGVYHRGLVVLDFIPLTSIAGPEAPCWDGLWTGPRLETLDTPNIGYDILQIQKVRSQGVDHCYAAMLSPADDDGIRRIQLWELTLEVGPDQPLEISTLRTPRSIVSPRLDFGNRLEQKTLEALDLWIDNMAGTVDIKIYYRPDEYPCWFFWREQRICATTQRCGSSADANGCVGTLNLQRQYRARVGAQRPPDYRITGANLPSRLGFTHQIRFDIIGDCELTAYRLLANRVTEAVFGAPGDATCQEIVCCDLPDVPAPVPPIPPGPGTGPVGIVEENETVWITTEDPKIIRTEDQPQWPPTGGTPGTVPGTPGSPGTPGTPGTGTPPIPNSPNWPNPPDLTCSGVTITGAIAVVDPIANITRFVGIPVGGGDPMAYMAALAGAGAVDEWAQAVWADFIAKGIAYTQAQIVWWASGITGDNFNGKDVFPGQPGNYHLTTGLDTTLTVMFCPKP